MKLQFRHPIYPPAIVWFPESGKTYLMPGWTEVSADTKLLDVEWIHEQPVRVDIKPKKTEWMIESSTSPGQIYTVKLFGSKYTCNCYGVRRAKDGKCKHIKQVENEL